MSVGEPSNKRPAWIEPLWSPAGGRNQSQPVASRRAATANRGRAGPAVRMANASSPSPPGFCSTLSTDGQHAPSAPTSAAESRQTRRSQVQILPPLLESPGNPGAFLLSLFAPERLRVAVLRLRLGVRVRVAGGAPRALPLMQFTTGDRKLSRLRITLSANRKLALRTRTLFASAQMPRAPEGASACFGASAGILAAGPVEITIQLVIHVASCFLARRRADTRQRAARPRDGDRSDRLAERVRRGLQTGADLREFLGGEINALLLRVRALPNGTELVRHLLDSPREIGQLARDRRDVLLLRHLPGHLILLRPERRWKRHLSLLGELCGYGRAARMLPPRCRCYVRLRHGWVRAPSRRRHRRELARIGVAGGRDGPGSSSQWRLHEGHGRAAAGGAPAGGRFRDLDLGSGGDRSWGDGQLLRRPGGGGAQVEPGPRLRQHLLPGGSPDRQGARRVSHYSTLPDGARERRQRLRCEGHACGGAAVRLQRRAGGHRDAVRQEVRASVPRHVQN